MITIFLYGLPGSGKRTLANELSKHYSVDYYEDFYLGDIDTTYSSSELVVISCLATNMDTLKIDPDKKMMLVYLPTIFEETVDGRYSELTGVDFKYIYEQKDELPKISLNEKWGQFYKIVYNYDIDELRGHIEDLKNSNQSTFSAAMEEVRKSGLFDKLQMGKSII